jgi:hypothetical protein
MNDLEAATASLNRALLFTIELWKQLVPTYVGKVSQNQGKSQDPQLGN